MNDYELLYYIYQKDEEALEMLMEKHQKDIFFIVKRTIEKYNYHCSTSDEFNEMIHIGTLELYRAIYNYCDDGRCSFRVYAQKCIEMGIRKYLRHRRGIVNYLMSNALSLDEEIREGEGIYYVDSVQNQNKEFEGDMILKWYHEKNLLQFLKNQLKDSEFIIVKLKLEGYSQVEISQMLMISHKRVCYVCGKMRKLLLSYID